MRKLAVCLVAAATVMGLTGTASAAEPGPGQVVITQGDFLPAKVHQDPEGCQFVSPMGHELTNLTDKPVKLYPDPVCGAQPLELPPGASTHVSGRVLSFSV